MDQLRLARRVDLAPQLADVDVDEIGAGVEAVVPHAFEQDRPRHDLPRVADEEFEELELARDEVEVAARASRLAIEKVDLEILEAQHGLLAVGGAPRQNLDAGAELGRKERLRQVVVAPCPQSADPVVDARQGAEHEHWGADAGDAQAVQQGQTVEPRQQTVERDHIETLGLGPGEARGPGAFARHHEAGGREILHNLGRGLGIVLDHQHAKHVGLRSGRRRRPRCHRSPAMRPTQGGSGRAGGLRRTAAV